MSRKNGPWIINKSEILYSSPWVNFRVDKSSSPSGKITEWGIPSLNTGVVTIAFDGQNIFLNKEFRYALEKKSYELPGGYIESGEDILTAAKRELLEEQGIKASKWIDLGFIVHITGQVQSKVYFFLAMNLSFSNLNQEETEDIKIQKINLKKSMK